MTSISDRALVRLIPDSRHKPPVLRGLVDTDDEMEVLAELEGWTSARLVAEREGSPGVDRRELAFERRQHDLRVYGQTHVNAAFTYTRSDGNRFNGPERGAWYCSYHVLTAAHEVGYHKTRELGYVGVYEEEARYVELLADFIGDFPDLHDEPNHPALAPDPAAGYPEGQKVALDLRRKGYKGLLYPSVRHRQGSCFVAFDPGIIQNVRPGAAWKLVWSGSPDYTVEGLPPASSA